MTTMSTRRALTATGAILAAVLMVVLGFWEVVAGIAAVAEDPLFDRPGAYLGSVDLVAWGWAHVTVGAVTAVAGVFVFTGRVWARVVGMFLAMVVSLLNFAFIPYYPVWAILCLALGIGVIWALADWEPRALSPPSAAR